MKNPVLIGLLVVFGGVAIAVMVVFPWVRRPPVDVAVISELQAADFSAIVQIVEGDLELPGRVASVGYVADVSSGFVDKVKGDSWPKIYLRIDSRPIAATEVSANVICGGADCDYEMRYRVKKGSRGWQLVDKHSAPSKYGFSLKSSLAP